MRGIVRRRGSIDVPLVVLSIYTPRARRVRERATSCDACLSSDPCESVRERAVALIRARHVRERATSCDACQVSQFRPVYHSTTAARPGVCNSTIDPAP